MTLADYEDAWRRRYSRYQRPTVLRISFAIAYGIVFALVLSCELP